MESTIIAARTKLLVKNYKTHMILGLLLAALLLLLPACQENQSDVISPVSGGSDNLQAGVYTEGNTNDNTIQFSQVKFVLRKMTLEYDRNHESECNVKLGPFVVALDLGTKVLPVGIAKVPFETYDAVKFQVHKPTHNDEINDPDFYEGNRSYSVVVKGMYNGAPFIYKSKVTVAKKIEFEVQPLTVAAPQMVYFTIRINPYNWFYENGEFIDPSIESNHQRIDQNILFSLRRAFRDMNQDGEPD